MILHFTILHSKPKFYKKKKKRMYWFFDYQETLTFFIEIIQWGMVQTRRGIELTFAFEKKMLHIRDTMCTYY